MFKNFEFKVVLQMQIAEVERIKVAKLQQQGLRDHLIGSKLDLDLEFKVRHLKFN